MVEIINTKLLLIGVLMPALALGGWFLLRPREKVATVSPGARAGDLFLESCTVKISNIRYHADCGMLVVPKNRSDPASHLIALPVKRIRSLAALSGDGGTAEPIFYLSGGPGQSNMGFRPPAWLLANHAFTLLFHHTTASIILDAYLTAERDDSSSLALMSLSYDFIMPKMMTWGEFLAIGSSADFEADRNHRAELTTPDAILGAPMSLLIWGSARAWLVMRFPLLAKVLLGAGTLLVVALVWAAWGITRRIRRGRRLF